MVVAVVTKPKRIGSSCYQKTLQYQTFGRKQQHRIITLTTWPAVVVQRKKKYHNIKNWIRTFLDIHDFQVDTCFHVNVLVQRIELSPALTLQMLVWFTQKLENCNLEDNTCNWSSRLSWDFTDSFLVVFQFFLCFLLLSWLTAKHAERDIEQ